MSTDPPVAGPLVTVPELAGALRGGHPPVLLDVRWSLAGPPGRESYDAGHLPGACFLDLDRELAGPPGAAGRHPLPTTADLEAAMRRCGVSGDSPVVVYDEADGTSAARAWWLLRYHGHSDVRLLDGGFRAWVGAGLAVTTDACRCVPGAFRARPGALPVLDADTAAVVARDGVLLDARAGERYRGDTEPVDPVAGHVPGAVSAPTAGNVGADGRFRPAEELHARFAALGVRPGVEVAAYCGSGVTAAHEVLALTLAGIPDVGLYAGSWSEWVADPERPVATGDQP